MTAITHELVLDMKRLLDDDAVQMALEALDASAETAVGCRLCDGVVQSREGASGGEEEYIDHCDDCPLSVVQDAVAQLQFRQREYSTPPDDDAVVAIEARLNAATPGPWQWVGGRGVLSGFDDVFVLGEVPTRGDTDFVLHAPEDIAALLTSACAANTRIRELEALEVDFANLLLVIFDGPRQDDAPTSTVAAEWAEDEVKALRIDRDEAIAELERPLVVTCGCGSVCGHAVSGDTGAEEHWYLCLSWPHCNHQSVRIERAEPAAENKEQEGGTGG